MTMAATVCAGFNVVDVFYGGLSIPPILDSSRCLRTHLPYIWITREFKCKVVAQNSSPLGVPVCTYGFLQSKMEAPKEFRYLFVASRRERSFKGLWFFVTQISKFSLGPI